MVRSYGYAELAGSLATVAIAALGGPLPAAGAALAEVVKLAQGRYAAGAPMRDLRRQVTADIRQWADGEKLAGEEVRLGLTAATETVARFGLGYEEIAALRFDSQEASTTVLEAARASDKYWGTENHYEVAARGIAETYRVLIHQFRASEKILLPAIQVLRGSIDENAARAETSSRSTQAKLGDLATALIAAGTVAEVMAYLRARIADWDVSVWHPLQTQSALESRLGARTIGPEVSSGDQAPTAEEALDGQRMLVVLGGPGSGKTWLARRYARKAAQSALSSLEDGADLDQVELPLFTTWDQWTKTPGSPRQALVAASFASGLGHSDAAAGDTTDRLQRTFTQPGTKVLLVVDSLDEAADHAGQASRLRELTSLHGWRIVVTSRPAAWAATYRGEPDRTDAPRVATLRDLKYPGEVEAFARAWFAAEPALGDALIKQIRARDDLARIAVIPLMLTFYCLLSEEPADTAAPLPARRRDLYHGLVKRLLRGTWANNPPGPDAAPEVAYCEALLTQWAWHAVHDRTTPAGLGDWGDTFPQPAPPRPGQGRGIDHVAPKVTEDDEGQITRRFVHRTVLEHFVAEHIAALDPDEAARVLLPHLWFDPDWQVTAPAAVAAHNRRRRGELLQCLLEQALHPATDPARQAASREFDRLLLAIAEESEPGDWTPEHQDLLHKCRERSAASEPEAVARTAHWTDSNHSTRAALLTALPTAKSWAVRELVAALPALVTTDADRDEARAALLAALPTADPLAAGGLWAALPALLTTEADRAEARAAVLAALPTTDLLAAGGLWAALPALVTTDADRAEARAAVLAALPTTDLLAAGGLWAALPALVTTDADRAEARAALLAALPTTEPEAVHGLVAALPALVTTDADRAEARAALLTALPTADPEAVHGLVAVLLALEPTAADRDEARAALLAALPTAKSWAVRELVAALPALVTTDADRAQARAALLAALPTAGDRWAVRELVAALPALVTTDADRAQARAALLAVLPRSWEVGELVAALPALVTTDADRDEARAALLAALPTAGALAVAPLMAALPALVTTDADRAQARAALLAALPTAGALAVAPLMAALQDLGLSDADRAQARAALLAALPVGELVAALPALPPTAKSWAVLGLVAALPALEPTAADRDEARAALLAALPTADPEAVRELVAALPALVTTDADRAQARAALLAALPTAGDRWAVRELVAALPALVTTDADRAQARAALLAALPTAGDRWAVRELVAALPALVTTDADRAQARAALLAALLTADPETVRDLATAVRSVSPGQSWVAWLANHE